jgi:hypothetical protein
MRETLTNDARRKPSEWDGPMVGRFTLTLSFPIPDGSGAGAAGDVMHAILAAAHAAGVLPKGTRVHGWETRARPLADEERARSLARKREQERRARVAPNGWWCERCQAATTEPHCLHAPEVPCA